MTMNVQAHRNVISRQTIARFCCCFWEASTASAMVSDEKISTTVLVAARGLLRAA